MRICLSQFPHRIELRRRGDAGDPGAGNDVLPAPSLHAAFSQLQRYCRDSPAIGQLGLVAGLADRSSQDEVLRAIAAGVASGRFLLVRVASTGGGNAPAGAGAPPPAPAATAPRRPAVREQAPLPPPSRKPGPSAVVEEPNDMADVAQDVQAAALEDAAQQGTPFCEVCEKARQEREAGQGQEA